MRLQRGKKNFSKTIQEGLDYATIQLCQIEDETGQEFFIEFESQPNELQEKEFADAPTVYDDDLAVKMI
ncbi:hypothetical protein MKW92_007728 [Papaver armeniacum]|nr:hypothetical protein MKW92_007728 [Papaver armeniacum]